MILIKHCALWQNEVISLNRCVIITSFQTALLKESFLFRENDYIICADGGYSYAFAEGIRPHIIIGDFDSMDVNQMETCSKDYPIIRYAAEKDDTDTMICLNYGIDQGFSEFFILGGLGGRLDHTIANLQTMSHALDLQKSIWIFDGKNKAAMRNPGEVTIYRQEGFKLSLFAFTGFCEGVSIRGVKYPLKDALLNHSFPLGVSNEFIDDKAKISHRSGKLLIVLSQD